MEGLIVPLLVAFAAGCGFVVNEWSEGELSAVIGLGHHHMGSTSTCDAHASMHGWARPCEGPRNMTWNRTGEGTP